MVKKATSGVLIMLLLFGLFGFNWPIAKAQTASPSQAVITVSGVPTGTKGLAVEVTVDTSIVTLGSASSSVSGALAVTGSMSEGVGIISTSGDLPASFTITVPLTGVKVGSSMLTVGMVLDMLGGTAITGASAAVDKDTIAVASSSSTTSSTSSTGGGALDKSTITVTVNGTAVNQTNALNVTVSFSDSSVAKLTSDNPTFMGTGATQLLSASDPTTSVLTAVWTGTISNGIATIVGMLAAGTMAGTTMIGVTKVEAAGGTDITGSVVATVDPTSVTNGAGAAGVFVLIGPEEVTGPGKAAIAISGSAMSATLNGKKVDFVKSNVGIAIVDVPAMGSLSLSLTADGVMSDLGSVSVTAGTGKAPKVNSASATNKSSGTKLVVTGKKFSKTDTTVEIVPTDRSASSTTVKGAAIKASYASSECIPNGSYVNVSTPGGTSAKKIKVHGSCSNDLVE